MNAEYLALPRATTLHELSDKIDAFDAMIAERQRAHGAGVEQRVEDIDESTRILTAFAAVRSLRDAQIAIAETESEFVDAVRVALSHLVYELDVLMRVARSLQRRQRGEISADRLFCVLMHAESEIESRFSSYKITLDGDDFAVTRRPAA